MTPRSHLRLIAGEGRPAARALPVDLCVLRSERQSPKPRQWPHVRPGRKAVVSVGLEAYEAEKLIALVRSIGAGVVCDVRVSPSFRGRGARYYFGEEFAAMAEVRYRHWPKLCNRHGATSWNQAIMLERYARDLTEDPAAIHELGALIGNGPLVLLGRGADHDFSERAVLCSRLYALGFELELVIASLA